MVDSINIPQNLTKVVEIDFNVRDTSEPLKRFLTDLLIRIEQLEERVTELESL